MKTNKILIILGLIFIMLSNVNGYNMVKNPNFDGGNVVYWDVVYNSSTQPFTSSLEQYISYPYSGKLLYTSNPGKSSISPFLSYSFNYNDFSVSPYWDNLWSRKYNLTGSDFKFNYLSINIYPHITESSSSQFYLLVKIYDINNNLIDSKISAYGYGNAITQDKWNLFYYEPNVSKSLIYYVEIGIGGIGYTSYDYIYLDNIDFNFYRSLCNLTSDCADGLYCDNVLSECLPKIENNLNCSVSKECYVSSDCDNTCLNNNCVYGICRSACNVCSNTSLNWDSHFQRILSKYQTGEIRHTYSIDNSISEKCLPNLDLSFMNINRTYNFEHHINSNDWEYISMFFSWIYGTNYIYSFTQTQFTNDAYNSISTLSCENDSCYLYNIEDSWMFDKCNNWYDELLYGEYCFVVGDLYIAGTNKTEIQSIVHERINDSSCNYKVIAFLPKYELEETLIFLVLIDDEGHIVYNKSVDCEEVTGNKWYCENNLNLCDLNITKNFTALYQFTAFDVNEHIISDYKEQYGLTYNTTNNYWYITNEYGNTPEYIGNVTNDNLNITGQTVVIREFIETGGGEEVSDVEDSIYLLLFLGIVIFGIILVMRYFA